MSQDIYTFRVLVDTAEEEDVFRDISIAATDTFESLHLCIQEVFEFDNSQMASFYMSDADWERGQEVALMDVATGSEAIPLMANTPLNKYFNKTQKRALYVFDFLVMWTFFVELVSIDKAADDVTYPVVILEVGESPDQFSKEPEDLFGAMNAVPDGDSEDEDLDDDYNIDEEYY